MGLLPKFVCLVLYTIIQFCILVLAVTAIPLPQYGPKVGNTLCTTYWGTTKKCNGVEYFSKGKLAFGCEKRVNLMKAAAALAIVGSVVALVLLALALLAMLSCCFSAPTVVLTIITGINVLVLTVPWAIVAGIMTNKTCPTDLAKMSKTKNYKPGFPLMVAAWGAEIINFALLLLAMC